MRHALLIVSIVFSILLAALPGHAQSRVALVIGNSAYRNASLLPNTQNDAADIAASFQRLGFSVKTLHNATFDDMRRALLQFGRDTRGSDMAVVYFAGHGMEVGGENWLVPVDAELRSDQDVENEAISLKSAMLQVANAASLGLVILDSCRDNPFAAQMQRVSRTRAVDRGLARVEPTDNVLVAYAAKDGTVASDGRGRNSPFTTALLNNLEKAGVEIRFLLATVRDEVLAATNRQQQPFVYGSLSPRPIYLKPPAQPPSVAAASPPAVVQPLTEVERAWAAVQASPSVAAMEAFVRRFGDSFYADLARVKIEELKRAQAAVVPQAQKAAPNPTPPTAVAPQGASPTGGPCGSRAVASIDPCPATQDLPPQQAAIPPPAAGSPPSLQDRLRARLAALTVAAGEAEARARDYELDKDHKAIAVGVKAHLTWRTNQWPSDETALTAVMEKCQLFFGEPCALAAVGEKVESASGPPVLHDMPRARYDGWFDPTQIPGANENLRRRTDVTSYRSASGAKAAAYHPRGTIFIVAGTGGQFEAEELALTQCNDDPVRKGRDGPCFLYATGDQVVLPQRSLKSLTPRRIDSPPSQQAAIPPPAAGSQTSLHDRLLARFAELSIAASETEATARNYEAGRDPKAIAVAIKAHRTWRATGRSSQEAAVTSTLEGCQVYYAEPCTLVAVGDKVEPAPVRDMPRTQYTGRFEPERVPSADDNLLRRAEVAAYRSVAGPKAAGYHPWGLGSLYIVTGAPGQFEAEEQVLTQCNDDPRRKAERQEGPCFLYAVGDRVVLPQRLTKPRPKPETIREAFDYFWVPGYSYAYLNEKGHKAIAVAPESRSTYRVYATASVTTAEQRALEGCQLSYRTHCVLLASEDALRASDLWKAERYDMPRLNHKGRYEPSNVPLFSGTEDRLRSYSALSAPKAMAIRPDGGRVNIATGVSLTEAQSKALAGCNDDSDPLPCFVYAVNERVILDQRRTEPLK